MIKGSCTALAGVFEFSLTVIGGLRAYIETLNPEPEPWTLHPKL